MKVRVGGAWKDIAGASVRVGGSWRRLQAIKVYSDAAWRDVATFSSPLTLALSAGTVTKAGTSSTVTTTLQTLAIPTGGQGPFTYAWVKQDGGNITATQPALAGTFFRATAMAVDEARSATFRCTCTDAFGASATADVAVGLRRYDTGGTA